MQVSYQLRRLLNVDANLLEILPIQAGSTDVTHYVGRQFNSRWLQGHGGQQNTWAGTGLRDQAAAERSLGYLCEYALRDGSIAKWLREELGQIRHSEEARHARRFLAMKMGDALCFGGSGCRSHRSIEEVQSRLDGYVANEGGLDCDRKDAESPHYRGFICSFLDHLDDVAKGAPGERPAQPGDEQLLRFRNKQAQPTKA
jgi:hypothetical protein